MFLIILLVFILSLIKLSNNTCIPNYRCHVIYDGRSETSRSTFTDKPVFFGAMVYHLGKGGVRKFVERGFEFAKDLATKINIHLIDGNIDLKIIKIHYKITDLVLDEFEVIDFDYTLPVEEGQNSGLAYLNNGEIHIVAGLEWSTTSWPPLEDHYHTEISVKKFSLQANAIIDSPAFDSEEFKELCPHHMYFKAKDSIISLGVIKIDLKNEDGSGSALEAIINLILPAFINVLQDELGEVFIDTIFSVASDAIWASSNYGTIDTDLTENLSNDDTIAQVTMSQKGVTAVMGGHYYIRNDEGLQSEEKCDSLHDMYLPDIFLPDKNPGVYQILPSHPSPADISITYHKELINSFYYQVALNDYAYISKKITTKENCEICSNDPKDDEETRKAKEKAIKATFEDAPIKYLDENIQLFDVDQLEAYENLLEYPDNYEIGYVINRNKEKEVNKYDFPKVIDIGAGGLLGEGKVKVDLYIVNKLDSSKNVFMTTLESPMQFVMHPYSKLVETDPPDDGGLAANVTYTYFNFVPYGFKSNDRTYVGKLVNKLYTRENDIYEDTHKTMTTYEIISLPDEVVPMMAVNYEIESLPYLLALIQKNIIAIYLTNYFHSHNLTLMSPNSPLYKEEDHQYFTYKKDYMVWNCDL